MIFKKKKTFPNLKTIFSFKFKSIYIFQNNKPFDPDLAAEFFVFSTVIFNTSERQRGINLFCPTWCQIRQWTRNIFCCLIVYARLRMDRALGHDWMLLGRGRDKLSFFQHSESASKELSGGTTLFMWIYTSSNKCAKNMTPQTD